MKQQLHYLVAIALFFNVNILLAQSTEDFETETVGASTFTDNGQAFTITNGAGETTYSIYQFAGGGWNGTGADNKFIDNSGGTPATNDGSSFSITTTDGADITVKSFYLFVSNRSITGPAATTLTITGKKDGFTVYTIVKSSGIVDGSSFTPNNGFTFIDFSTEGGSNNSNTNVDEIAISTTGNADYLALDAFAWGAEVLSVNDIEITSNVIKILPNPSSNYIQFSGLKESTSFVIYDILGKRVQADVSAVNQTIDISSLREGIYLVVLDGKRSLKLIKS